HASSQTVPLEERALYLFGSLHGSKSLRIGYAAADPLVGRIRLRPAPVVERNWIDVLHAWRAHLLYVQTGIGEGASRATGGSHHLGVRGEAGVLEIEGHARARQTRIRHVSERHRRDAGILPIDAGDESQRKRQILHMARQGANHGARIERWADER